MERYLLPITALLASTKGIHQEIVFHTRLPSQRISQEACVVHLHARAGSMLSCEISEATGGRILFQQEQAIDALKPLGMLEWYQTPLPVDDAEAPHEHGHLSWQSGSSWPMAQQIPRRRNGQFPTLDHTQRRVFLLVDGARSVHQIASLLGKPPEKILSLLHLLQDATLITWEKEDRKT